MDKNVLTCGKRTSTTSHVKRSPGVAHFETVILDIVISTHVFNVVLLSEDR